MLRFMWRVCSLIGCTTSQNALKFEVFRPVRKLFLLDVKNATRNEAANKMPCLDKRLEPLAL